MSVHRPVYLRLENKLREGIYPNVRAHLFESLDTSVNLTPSLCHGGFVVY